jgi:hypothetical protein
LLRRLMQTRKNTVYTEWLASHDTATAIKPMSEWDVFGVDPIPRTTC